MQRRKTIFVVGSLVVIGLLVAAAIYFDSVARRINDTIYVQLTDIARTTFVPRRTSTSDLALSSDMRSQAINAAYSLCYLRTNVDMDACSRYVTDFFLHNDANDKYILTCVEQVLDWAKDANQSPFMNCLINFGVPLPPSAK